MTRTTRAHFFLRAKQLRVLALLGAGMLAPFFFSAPSVAAHACTGASSCYGASATNGAHLADANPPAKQTATNDTQESALMNPLGTTNVQSLLAQILAFIVKIGAIVVILMIIYVGFQFVTARGEPSKITKARQTLLWTVVGALILLGAQAIALGIQATVQAISTGP